MSEEENDDITIVTLCRSVSAQGEELGVKRTAASKFAREALDVDVKWDFDSVDAAVRLATSRLRGSGIDAAVLPDDKPVFVQTALELSLASESVNIYPLHRYDDGFYPRIFLNSI